MDQTSFPAITTDEAPNAEEAFTPVDMENVSTEDALPQGQDSSTAVAGDETQPEEDEIEEELIIEDFTIDGICGVY
jgi:mycofactocin precursor